MEEKTEGKIRKSEAASKTVTGTPKMGFFAVVSLSLLLLGSNTVHKLPDECFPELLQCFLTGCSDRPQTPSRVCKHWAEHLLPLLNQNAALGLLRAAGHANGRILPQTKAKVLVALAGPCSGPGRENSPCALSPPGAPQLYRALMSTPVSAFAINLL